MEFVWKQCAKAKEICFSNGCGGRYFIRFRTRRPEKYEVAMGVLVRVSLVGVSQLRLLSLDHQDVKFLLVTQAEVAALAAIRTLDATVSIASMNLELANYYSICFRNLQVLFYSSFYLFSVGSQIVSPSLGLVSQREGVVRRRGQTDRHREANSAAKCDLEG